MIISILIITASNKQIKIYTLPKIVYDQNMAYRLLITSSEGPWARAHGTMGPGPGPWDHGTGPMGPWDRARGTMGPGPWDHGTGPMGPLTRQADNHDMSAAAMP